MMDKASNWRVVVGGAAVGVAGVVGLAGATASAEPVLPQPPTPAPATAPQTVAVSPVAASPAMAVASTSLPSPASIPGALSTVPAPAAAPLVPASSGTLADFFKEKDVQAEPQTPQNFTALKIVLPVPTGWTQVPDPNVPDAFAVIADRAGDALYTPNAQLVVYKLIGDFDPNEAITHGYLDATKLFAWQSTNASLAEFGGFPSSLIEGTYRENDMTLNTYQRDVIATAGADKYLVSLSVTTAANQVVAAADAVDTIVNGFRVTAAAPAPASAPAALHGQPPLPGLPPSSALAPAPPA